MKSRIILTDYAYKLLGATRPIQKQSQTIIGRGFYESGATSPDDGFNRIQTKYHGIPEHLIQSNDHD